VGQERERTDLRVGCEPRAHPGSFKGGGWEKEIAGQEGHKLGLGGLRATQGSESYVKGLQERDLPGKEEKGCGACEGGGGWGKS